MDQQETPIVSDELTTPLDTDPLADAELLTELIRAFVPHPQDVRIEERNDGQICTLIIHINPGDVGVVVGRDHSTIYALRHIFSRVAAANGIRTYLHIAGEFEQEQQQQRRPMNQYPNQYPNQYSNQYPNQYHNSNNNGHMAPRPQRRFQDQDQQGQDFGPRAPRGPRNGYGPGRRY